MRHSHNDCVEKQSGRLLAWPLIVVWLLSSLAQAASCCCGAAVPSPTHGNGEVAVLTHDDGLPLNHHASGAADAGLIPADDAPRDTTPSCTEVKQPDASLQSKHVLYGASDQIGLVRLGGTVAPSGAPPVAAALRPSSIPPPALNPFLSTVRLLL